MTLNYIKFLALYTIAAIVVGTGALAAAYPYHPITTAGWVVWFLLALPGYVTLEAIAGRIFSKRIGYKIDESREGISVSRIIFGFAFAVTAMLVGMVIVLSAGVAGGNFWEVNYSSTW